MLLILKSFKIPDSTFAEEQPFDEKLQVDEAQVDDINCHWPLRDDLTRRDGGKILNFNSRPLCCTTNNLPTN